MNGHSASSLFLDELDEIRSSAVCNKEVISAELMPFFSEMGKRIQADCLLVSLLRNDDLVVKLCWTDGHLSSEESIPESIDPPMQSLDTTLASFGTCSFPDGFPNSKETSHKVTNFQSSIRQKAWYVIRLLDGESVVQALVCLIRVLDRSQPEAPVEPFKREDVLWAWLQSQKYVSSKIEHPLKDKSSSSLFPHEKFMAAASRYKQIRTSSSGVWQEAIEVAEITGLLEANSCVVLLGADSNPRSLQVLTKDSSGWSSDVARRRSDKDRKAILSDADGAGWGLGMPAALPLEIPLSEFKKLFDTQSLEFGHAGTGQVCRLLRPIDSTDDVDISAGVVFQCLTRKYGNCNVDWKSGRTLYLATKHSDEDLALIFVKSPIRSTDDVEPIQNSLLSLFLYWCSELAADAA